MINYRELVHTRLIKRKKKEDKKINISNNTITTILTGLIYALIAIFQFSGQLYYKILGWYINISIENIILIAIIVYFLIISILPFFETVDLISLNIKKEKEKAHYIWAIASIVISAFIMFLILEIKRTNNYDSLYAVFFLFLFLFAIFSNILRKIFGKDIIINKFKPKVTNIRRTMIDISVLFLIIILIVAFLGVYTSLDKKTYTVFDKDGKKAFVIKEYKNTYIAAYYDEKTNVKESGYFFISPTDIKILEEKEIGRITVR